MKEKSEPKDVYQHVTNKIIEHLEKGTIPWKQPWKNSGVPRNLISGKPYKGLNALMLSCLDYEKNLYLTFHQIEASGGSIKKGEKACEVIFYKWLEAKDNETGETKKVPFLRYYNVFNIAQCTGIMESLMPPQAEVIHEPMEICESIIDNMPKRPQIRHKGDKAFYHPIEDFVNLPKTTSFENRESFYSVLFHELIHSTGHQSRLNRKELMQLTDFGSTTYSIEELTAEIGACFLNSHAGIANTPIENNVAYIAGWLSKLKNDKKFIFYASSQAQKAVDYILNVPVYVPKEAMLPEKVELLAEELVDGVPF